MRAQGHQGRGRPVQSAQPNEIQQLTTGSLSPQQPHLRLHLDRHKVPVCFTEIVTRFRVRVAVSGLDVLRVDVHLIAVGIIRVGQTRGRSHVCAARQPAVAPPAQTSAWRDAQVSQGIHTGAQFELFGPHTGPQALGRGSLENFGEAILAQRRAMRTAVFTALHGQCGSLEGIDHACLQGPRVGVVPKLARGIPFRTRCSRDEGGVTALVSAQDLLRIPGLCPFPTLQLVLLQGPGRGYHVLQAHRGSHVADLQQLQLDQVVAHLRLRHAQLVAVEALAAQQLVECRK
mmetsp:Transcript_34065/g.75083  ORF Transcript_34065/g.75083 Transcript_34065/m.75083 type:complete len:288 (+) Transcript_34065:3442-4305(+)